MKYSMNLSYLLGFSGHGDQLSVLAQVGVAEYRGGVPDVPPEALRRGPAAEHFRPPARGGVPRRSGERSRSHLLFQ